MTKKDRSLIQAWEMRLLRSVLGITGIDRMRNPVVRELLKERPINTITDVFVSMENHIWAKSTTNRYEAGL